MTAVILRPLFSHGSYICVCVRHRQNAIQLYEVIFTYPVFLCGVWIGWGKTLYKRLYKRRTESIQAHGIRTDIPDSRENQPKF